MVSVNHNLMNQGSSCDHKVFNFCTAELKVWNSLTTISNEIYSRNSEAFASELIKYLKKAFASELLEHIK